MKQKVLLAIITISSIIYLIGYSIMSSAILTGLAVITLVMMLYLAYDLKTDINKNSAVYLGLLIVNGVFLLIPILFYDENRSLIEQLFWTILVIGIVVYGTLKEYKWTSK